MISAPIVSDHAPYDEYICVNALINNIDMNAYRLNKIDIQDTPHPLTGVAIRTGLFQEDISIARLVVRAVRKAGFFSDQ